MSQRLLKYDIKAGSEEPDQEKWQGELKMMADYFFEQGKLFHCPDS